MNEWSVQVFENPGIVEMKFSPHYYFSRDDEDHSPADPYFSTRHTSGLNIEKSYRAYCRLTNILRIVSSINVILTRRSISFSDSIYHYDGRQYRNVNYIENSDIYLEELVNPFDPNIIEEIRSRPLRLQTLSERLSLPGKIMEYSIESATAREILLWVSFGEESILYFITNAYKIYESITTDMTRGGINIDDFSSLGLAVSKMAQHKRYMNTKANSGMLSRHGNSNHEPTNKIPTIDEIKIDLYQLIIEWFKVKFILDGDPGRHYKVE